MRRRTSRRGSATGIRQVKRESPAEVHHGTSRRGPAIRKHAPRDRRERCPRGKTARRRAHASLRLFEEIHDSQHQQMGFLPVKPRRCLLAPSRSLEMRCTRIVVRIAADSEESLRSVAEYADEPPALERLVGAASARTEGRGPRLETPRLLVPVLGRAPMARDDNAAAAGVTREASRRTRRPCRGPLWAFAQPPRRLEKEARATRRRGRRRPTSCAPGRPSP